MGLAYPFDYTVLASTSTKAIIIIDQRVPAARPRRMLPIVVLVFWFILSPVC